MKIFTEAPSGRVDAPHLFDDLLLRRARGRSRHIEIDFIQTVHDAGLECRVCAQPDVSDGRNAVDDQLAVVVLRQRIAGQDGFGRKQPLSYRIDRVGFGIGDQILDRQFRPVGQLGQRITQLLEDGDAGIVFVVVGPDVAREALDDVQTLFPEGEVVESRTQGFGAVDELRFAHGVRSGDGPSDP